MSELLKSRVMEAGQRCVNVSSVVCPWHGDSLNVDCACAVHCL